MKTTNMINKLKNSPNKFIQFIWTIIEKFTEEKINEKSAVMTYYVLLSVGPFLMALISFMTYFLQNRSEELIRFLRDSLPDAEYIVETVINYLSQANNGLIALVSTFLALYSVSKAITFLGKFINSIFQLNEKKGIKNFIKRTINSYIFTVAFVLSIIFFLIIIVYQDPLSWVFEYIVGLPLENYINVSLFANLTPFIYLFIVLTLLYKFIPNFNSTHRLPWKTAFLGAGFSSIGWIIMSGAFSIYVNNFNKKNIMYGTLGTIMVMMLWIFLLMTILLLGAVVIYAYNEIYLGHGVDQNLSSDNESE